MHVFLQGRASTLAFDEWVNVLNRRLRPAMNSHTVTKDGADVKETIKSVAKTLEDQKLFDLLTADRDAAAKRNVYLAALVYSYLESAPKLLNCVAKEFSSLIDLHFSRCSSPTHPALRKLLRCSLTSSVLQQHCLVVSARPVGHRKKFIRRSGAVVRCQHAQRHTVIEMCRFFGPRHGLVRLSRSSHLRTHWTCPQLRILDGLLCCSSES